MGSFSMLAPGLRTVCSPKAIPAASRIADPHARFNQRVVAEVIRGSSTAMCPRSATLQQRDT